jgi:hypothetical protein
MSIKYVGLLLLLGGGSYFVMMKLANTGTMPRVVPANQNTSTSSEFDEINQVEEEPKPSPKKQAKIPGPGDPIEIKWETLYEYDYETGKGPDELMKAHGKIVKIPGFVVPLSDNYQELQDLLLVPDAQSCIHVPPPPPNLIVTVKLAELLPGEEVANPAWITGKFLIEKTESEHGGSAYKIVDGILEKYEYED